MYTSEIQIADPDIEILYKFKENVEWWLIYIGI